MAGRIGAVFDQAEPLREQLCAGPSPQPQESAAEVGRTRWTLALIGQRVSFLQSYSLAGISKYIRHCGIRLRQGRPQYYSPDPAYRDKEARLLEVLGQVGLRPHELVALFIDEMSYTGWPEPSSDWCPQAPTPCPVADRHHSPYRRYRVVGALDAISGRVCFHQDSRISGEVFSHFLRQLDQAYPDAHTISLIWDNWPVHHSEVVRQTLAALPRLRVVSLPTYSPWLNPIEKLWRQFRQEVDYLHRWAHDWKGLRQRVAQFFAQFATGSQALLHYVGLSGSGKLARALQGSP